MPISFSCFLTVFVLIPTPFLNFKYVAILVCLLFVYAFNIIIIIYLSLPSRCLKALQAPTLLVLQVLVNKSVNMANQLYYSEIH